MLLKTRQQFCGDISILFQSHCQTRMKYLQAYYYNILFTCIYCNSKFVNTSLWLDNDFEIESKYHRKMVVLFLKARILSLQDAVFRSVFFLIWCVLYCMFPVLTRVCNKLPLSYASFSIGPAASCSDNSDIACTH